MKSVTFALVPVLQDLGHDEELLLLLLLHRLAEGLQHLGRILRQWNSPRILLQPSGLASGVSRHQDVTQTVEPRHPVDHQVHEVPGEA